jgi:hypothetical protein
VSDLILKERVSGMLQDHFGRYVRALSWVSTLRGLAALCCRSRMLLLGRGAKKASEETAHNASSRDPRISVFMVSNNGDLCQRYEIVLLY